METAPERKLTTILSADVAGYSRLMGADEAGTLASLRACRELLARQIARHRGRVVGQAGDSVLAEFGSVVGAVECAVAIQRELAERNAALPPERRMLFRIGVNLGDVLVDGGDLFGEGVNIAARLQALAEPGGILVSGPVFDQVRRKLTLGFDYLGPQSVKNIADEVPAYRVVLDGDAGPLPFRDASDVGPSGLAYGEPKDRLGERKTGPWWRSMRAPESALGRRQESEATPGRPLSRPTAPAEGHPPHRDSGRPESLRPQGERAGGPEALSKGARLKRRAAVTAILIALFVTINLLTWGEDAGPWFQWPTLGVLVVFALRTVWVGWR